MTAIKFKSFPVRRGGGAFRRIPRVSGSARGQRMRESPEAESASVQISYRRPRSVALHEAVPPFSRKR